MKNRVIFPFLVMVCMLIMNGMSLNAQDWSQWRGPNREGVFKGANLNLDWSTKKPPLLWTFRQAGAGYSAPTVVGTTLYCLGGEDENDFAFALDTQTGKVKWKQNLGKLHAAIQNRGNSSRGSVTVDGDKLYLVRADGVIHCIAAADGKMIWQKDLRADLGGNNVMGNWGFSESPLVDGNLVLCTPGGSQGTMAALDKNTGAVVWRTKEWTDDAGYSSPIIAEVGGIRQYIQQSNKGIAGVSAKDGKLLWRVENPAYKTAVIPTAIFNDNFVFATNGYNGGCMGIRLSKEGDGIKAETVYSNVRDISNQHGGIVLMNGFVFGHSDRPSNSWVCQNFKTGEIAWAQNDKEFVAGKGSILGVNDRLILLDMYNGTSAVISASSDGWKEFGKLEIPERTKITTQDNQVWTHPVVANDKLYIRDHDLLFCFDLKK